MSNNRKTTKPTISYNSDNTIFIHKLKIIKPSEIKPRPQKWLWEEYIPLNTCTLFAGIGGIGKSQLLLFLASCVSTGNPFQCGTQKHSLPKGKVLILSAEDSNDTSIVPRLIATDADFENIRIIESTLSNTTERFVALDTDIGILREEIKALGDVKLIIIDPVTAYLGSIHEHKATEVRNLILSLNKLAEEFDLSIILNTHLRKKSSGENASSAAEEVRGSGAWTGTVRQAFIVARDHEDPKKVYFLNMKRNIGEDLAGFSYRMKPYSFDNEDGELIKTSKIEWELTSANYTADEAIDKKAYEERGKIEEAKELILDALRFGSKSAEQIRQLAIQNEINEHTLKKARQAIDKEGKFSIAMEPSQVDKRKFIWYIRS